MWEVLGHAPSQPVPSNFAYMVHQKIEGRVPVAKDRLLPAFDLWATLRGWAFQGVAVAACLMLTVVFIQRFNRPAPPKNASGTIVQSGWKGDPSLLAEKPGLFLDFDVLKDQQL